MKIVTWCDRDAPLDECHDSIAKHPEIVEKAPSWANEVAFSGIFEEVDGTESIDLSYRLEEEDFCISVSADLDDGELVIHDIPDTVINEDFLDGPITINQRFLMGLLHNYIEHKEHVA